MAATKKDTPKKAAKKPTKPVQKKSPKTTQKKPKDQLQKSEPVEPTKKSWGPFSALFIAVISFIIPQIIAGFLIAIAISTFGGDVDAFFSEGNIAANFIFLIVFELLGIAMILGIMKWRKYDISLLKIGKPEARKLLWVLPGFGVYFVLSLIFTILTEQLYDGFVIDQDQSTGFEDATGNEVVLAFFALVVLAPLVEEFIFRGFLFRGFRTKMNFFFAALVSSFLFGLVHFQGGEGLGLNVMIDTFALALVLSYLVEKTDSLWPAIGLHAFKNFVAFMFIFILTIN